MTVWTPINPSAGVIAPLPSILENTINVKDSEYGATGNYVYPSSGADDTAAINAAITAATALIGTLSEYTYPTLYFPPGQYQVSAKIAIPVGINLWMDGATIVSTRTDDSDYDEPLIEVGDSATLNSYIDFRGIAVHYYVHTAHNFPETAASQNGFAAIKFWNVANSVIETRRIAGTQIGLLLMAGPSLWCAYNRLSLGNFNTTKICVDLRGNTSSGFVNENKFFGGSFQPTSNMNKYGSTFGVRFSTESGGYTGQNQNVFYGPSFEMGGETSWTALLSVPTTNTRLEYGGNEYLALSTGTTGATPPTHTTGDVTDGSIIWRYLGKYRKSPVHHKGAGGLNQFNACRWESGYGPFAYYTGSVALTSNTYQVYTASDPDTGSIGGSSRHIEDYNNPDAAANTFGLDNHIRAYGAALNKEGLTRVIDGLQMRALGSASGLAIAGMAFLDFFAPSVPLQHSGGTGSYILCIDGLSINTYTKIPGVYVHVGGNQKRILIDRHVRSAGRLYFLGFNKNFVSIAMTNANKYFKSSASAEVGSYAIRDASDLTSSKVVTVDDASGIEYLFVGLFGAVYQGISIRTVCDTLGSEGAVNVVLPWGVAGDTKRQSYETPTVGIFKKTGEFIENINTASAQVVGWYVKTAGYLSPAWVGSTAVILGEIRSNANKHYSAVAAGTTGATAPTHTSGSASDDVVSWTYLGVDAVLVASSQAYA